MLGFFDVLVVDLVAEKRRFSSRRVGDASRPALAAPGSAFSCPARRGFIRGARRTTPELPIFLFPPSSTSSRFHAAISTTRSHEEHPLPSFNGPTACGVGLGPRERDSSADAAAYNQQVSSKFVVNINIKHFEASWQANRLAGSSPAHQGQSKSPRNFRQPLGTLSELQ